MGSPFSNASYFDELYSCFHWGFYIKHGRSVNWDFHTILFYRSFDVWTLPLITLLLLLHFCIEISKLFPEFLLNWDPVRPCMKYLMSSNEEEPHLGLTLHFLLANWQRPLFLQSWGLACNTEDSLWHITHWLSQPVSRATPVRVRPYHRRAEEPTKANFGFSKASTINILDLWLIFNILDNLSIKIYECFQP